MRTSRRAAGRLPILAAVFVSGAALLSVELAASRVLAPLAAPQRTLLADRWDGVRKEHPLAPDLRKPILDRHDAAIQVSDVPTLTDDYAPTDALLLLFQ